MGGALRRRPGGGATVDVVLVTASRLPRPDGDDLPLRTALAALGMRVETRAWDDPTVDWGAAPVTVIRSTWNYVQNYSAYRDWLERCASVTQLWNPLPIVRWNIHKAYLVGLAAQGLPVLPTVLVPQGSRAVLADLAGEWSDVVIKPAVSAGSFQTIRVTRDRFDEGQRHLDQVGAARDVLVQPYLASVDGYGERACVWIDGAFTHAVRKAPRFAGDRQQVSAILAVADDEREVAERVLAAVPGPLLYARVDLARDAAGRPCLMELELIEPSLFLEQAPAACARLASAIARL